MSGVVRGIRKAFKKVTKFVKRYWKEIAVAAAVVFTAGAAMGAWGGAAGAGGTAASAGSTVASSVAGGTGAVASGASGAILSSGTFASGATTGLAASGVATGVAGTGAGMYMGGQAVNLATVSVTGTAPTGMTAVQKIALAAGSGAGAGNAFSKAAAEAIQPGSQTQQLEQPQQADTATPGESLADTGNPNDPKIPKPAAEKGGFIANTTSKVKEAWGGMSSFEKMMVLNTGVQMTSALLGPKEGEGFPLANQFYGRDTDAKGGGMAMDYDRGANQFVPGGAPMQPAEPVGQMGQPAPASRAPQQFVTPQQAGAPARNNERFLSANRAPDNDSLNRRMDFVTGIGG